MVGFLHKTIMTAMTGVWKAKGCSDLYLKIYERFST
jgi:hypothetical protein